MLTELSRFAIAIGYILAGSGLIVVARKYRGSMGGDHAIFAAAIAWAWAIWFALFSPPLMRGDVLHLPVIAFLWLAVWSRLKARRGNS